MNTVPIQVVTPLKAWIFGRLSAGIVGSNSARETLVSCQLEVPASGLSPVRRSSTECGVSECDREASTVRMSWPIIEAVSSWKKKTLRSLLIYLFVASGTFLLCI